MNFTQAVILISYTSTTFKNWKDMEKFSDTKGRAGSGNALWCRCLPCTDTAAPDPKPRALSGRESGNRVKAGVKYWENTGT